MLCSRYPAYMWRDSNLGSFVELREPVVLMLREKIQVVEAARIRVPMQSTGTESLVVVMKLL